MPPQVREIPQKWLERVHVASGTHPRTRKKCVKTHVCANVIDNLCGFKHIPKCNLFVTFECAEPAAVVARTDNPLCSSQRSSQDAYNGGVRDQPKRKTESPAKQGLVRYLREINRDSAPVASCSMDALPEDAVIIHLSVAPKKSLTIEDRI